MTLLPSKQFFVKFIAFLAVHSIFAGNAYAQPYCAGQLATIVGTQGSDTIWGTTGPDVIHGLGGNDTIYGGKGDDIICAGNGDDTVHGQGGNDTIYAHQGDDTVFGGSDDDVIYGSTGDDRLIGNSGNDTIYGHPGNDSLYGSSGDDRLIGHDGNDKVFGGGGEDYVNGGLNNDTVYGGSGHDEIHGGADDDILLGGGGDDLIFAGAGNDMIDGSSGQDTINGGGHQSADTCFQEATDTTVLLGCETQFIDTASRNLSEYELVFFDEFNGNQLDPNKWNTSMLWGPYLPINGEQQLYVDTMGINSNATHSPFELTGSTLKISATPTSSALQPPPRPGISDPVWDEYPEYRYNGPTNTSSGYDPDSVDYLSGIITSYDSFKMTHGYVEARVKLPAGRGLWPAFWMLNTHYVEDSPEIDVMEFLGQDKDTVYHTYHYVDQTNGWQGISTPSFETLGIDWTQTFHTFGMAWSPNEIVWYVDGVETRRIDSTQYDISAQAMYLIANLAVGGSWPGPPDTSTSFPAVYEIDYIRAYKRKLSNTLDLASDYQLMFNDEFNGTTLDSSKWNTAYLWGPYYAINNEEQYYVDSHGVDSDKSYSPFTVANGVLKITADLSSNSAIDVPPATLPATNDPIWTQYTAWQQGPYNEAPKYTSGLITSYDAFKFVNGYAEIRAKVPQGDGLWPAFWLLNAYYVGPLPEIDVMEILGENTAQAYHTFHRSNSNGVALKDEYISNVTDYAADFHTYGVHWQPGKITWYVDGSSVGTYEEADNSKNNAYQLMYVIANLAVGGSFNSEPVDDSALAADYVIDYIRVYQENDVP